MRLWMIMMMHSSLMELSSCWRWSLMRWRETLMVGWGMIMIPVTIVRHSSSMVTSTRWTKAPATSKVWRWSVMTSQMMLLTKLMIMRWIVIGWKCHWRGHIHRWWNVSGWWTLHVWRR